MDSKIARMKKFGTSHGLYFSFSPNKPEMLINKFVLKRLFSARISIRRLHLPKPQTKNPEEYVCDSKTITEKDSDKCDDEKNEVNQILQMKHHVPQNETLMQTSSSSPESTQQCSDLILPSDKVASSCDSAPIRNIQSCSLLSILFRSDYTQLDNLNLHNLIMGCKSSSPTLNLEPVSFPSDMHLDLLSPSSVPVLLTTEAFSSNTVPNIITSNPMLSNQLFSTEEMNSYCSSGSYTNSKQLVDKAIHSVSQNNDQRLKLLNGWDSSKTRAEQQSKRKISSTTIAKLKNKLHRNSMTNALKSLPKVDKNLSLKISQESNASTLNMYQINEVGDITINSLLGLNETKDVHNSSPVEVVTVKNPTVHGSDSLEPLNSSYINVEIDEIPYINKCITHEKLHKTPEESLRSPELSPKIAVTTQSTSTLILNPLISSTSEETVHSVPIITSEKEDIAEVTRETHFSESLIFESIKQIENYIAKGGLDILEQLTDDEIHFNSSMDLYESCASETSTYNQNATMTSIEDLSNEVIINAREKTWSRLQSLDHLFEEELTANSERPTNSTSYEIPIGILDTFNKKSISTEDPYFSYSPTISDSENSDDIRMTATDTITEQRVVSPGILKSWGMAQQSSNSSLNLETIQDNVVADRQLIPFRGLGKVPTIDVSISNAPLRGLDHHLSSNKNYTPTSKPIAKKVKKNTKTNLRKAVNNLVRNTQLQKCFVSVKRINIGKNMKLMEKMKAGSHKSIRHEKSIQSLRSNTFSELSNRVKLKGKPLQMKKFNAKPKNRKNTSQEKERRTNDKIVEATGIHLKPKSGKHNMGKINQKAEPLVVESKEICTSKSKLYTSTKKLVDRAIQSLYQNEDLKLKLLNGWDSLKTYTVQKVSKQKISSTTATKLKDRPHRKSTTEALQSLLKVDESLKLKMSQKPEASTSNLYKINDGISPTSDDIKNKVSRTTSSNKIIRNYKNGTTLNANNSSILCKATTLTSTRKNPLNSSQYSKSRLISPELEQPRQTLVTHLSGDKLIDTCQTNGLEVMPDGNLGNYQLPISSIENLQVSITPTSILQNLETRTQFPTRPAIADDLTNLDKEREDILDLFPEDDDLMIWGAYE